MTRFIPRGYANVVSTLALFVALGGGAYAAASTIGSGGVVHGCYQKKTGALSVVKAGKKCRKGSVAISWNQQGVPGTRGAAGAPGTAGTPGAAGANFTGKTTLQSGETESGSYSATATATATSPASALATVDFRIPLAAPIGSANLGYEKTGETSAHCPGAGKAAAGYLCLYEESSEHVNPQVVINPLTKTEGSSTTAFIFLATAPAGSEPGGSFGNWAVTAP